MFKTVKLDRESRRYVDVKVHNVIRSEELTKAEKADGDDLISHDDHLKQVVKHYGIEKCKGEGYTSEFEKTFYEDANNPEGKIHYKLKTKHDLALLLRNNVYDWYKDGEEKLDELVFSADGSYKSSVTTAKWMTQDEQTLLLIAGGKTFTIQFNEDGSEGVLVLP